MTEQLVAVLQAQSRKSPVQEVRAEVPVATLERVAAAGILPEVVIQYAFAELLGKLDAAPVLAGVLPKDRVKEVVRQEVRGEWLVLDPTLPSHKVLRALVRAEESLTLTALAERTGFSYLTVWSYCKQLLAEQKISIDKSVKPYLIRISPTVTVRG